MSDLVPRFVELGKVEVDGETPKVCDPSPEELGRAFQTLLEKHL
jgi:hypothetical protein